MTFHSDYCIVRELNDNVVDSKKARSAAEDRLTDLRSELKALIEWSESSDYDRDELRDKIECIDCTADDVQDGLDTVDNNLDDLDSMVEGADDFARQHLEEARDEGERDGYDLGYEEAECEYGREKVQECIDHYEEFVFECVEEWFGPGNADFDAIRYHQTVATVKSELADSKYEA
jgi:chromosome segregation ATPase